MSPPLTGRRVLVTGAGGFVGVALAHELQVAGAEVHALTRSAAAATGSRSGAQVVQHEGDIADRGRVRAVVEAASPELVFHLAARRAQQSAEERAATWAVNVGGTANLVDALTPHANARLIALGSGLEYGPSAQPIDELVPERPTDFYGASKAAASSLVVATAKARELKWAVLRPFFVYGPRQARSKLVPTICEAALAGRPIALTEPNIRRDWLYVDDLVDACLLAARADLSPGELLNVATGREWANEQLAQEVVRLTGSVSPLELGRHPARPWDREPRRADVTKAGELLGWRPRRGLEDGLRRTLDWVRSEGAVGA